jgi:FkbM family methyltransferase
MKVLDGLKWHYELWGMRGVCAQTSSRIFGWPRELDVTPRGFANPVHLRLGTSDFCSYRDVLIEKEKKYEPDIPNFSPRNIVDAGAHIGMASIGFAVRYPTAKIIALEPEPANYKALLRNVAPYRSIIPVQAALWKEDGEVGLEASDAHPRGAFQVVDNGRTKVRAMTMRTLMRETGLDSIDLLKLDIEGAEREVFEACDWIGVVQVIAVELHDRIKPGCRTAVQTATDKLRSYEQGDITFYLQ